MGQKVKCPLCGKEYFHPEAVYGQDLIFCGECQVVWIKDYFRRLKLRIASWFSP